MWVWKIIIKIRKLNQITYKFLNGKWSKKINNLNLNFKIIIIKLFEKIILFVKIENFDL